jgi:uncharacterized membrane protein YfcA
MITALSDTFATIGLAHMLAIWGALVFAALIRAFTGFGFALAAMPVLSLFVAPTEAVVLTASLTLAINLLTIRSFWPAAPKRQLLPILLAASVGTGLGAQLLTRFSVAQFQLWVGLGVVTACLLLTVYHPLPQPPRRGIRELTGLVSGLMNGAFAIPGPPIIIYAMATERDAGRSRSMLMTYFMLAAIVALIIFGAAGYLSLRNLWLFMLAMPAMLLGDRIGFTLFRKFGTKMYRRIALAVLYAVGISITLKALLG